MPHLMPSRLETVARLIARGYPPVLASARAGYRALNRRNVDKRAALPAVVARIAEIQAAASRPVPVCDRQDPTPIDSKGGPE